MSSNSGTKRKWAALRGTRTARITAHAALAVLLGWGGFGGAPVSGKAVAAAAICTRANAVDGDTLRCGNLGLVRLLAIDAPEMPGHCRAGRVCTKGDGNAAKRQLADLISGHTVRCTGTAKDRYGRLLARCSAAGRDLSCDMVASGHAVERYGRLNCK